MVFIEPRSGNNGGFCRKEDSNRRHVHNLVARLQEMLRILKERGDANKSHRTHI